MNETSWFAVVAALIAIGYADFRYRLVRLEKRQKLVISSLLKFAIEKDPVVGYQLLATATEKLMENGH